MGGFFGVASRKSCTLDLFYGIDYHSHLGTKRAGMAFYDGKKFVRSIHSLENGYFRNKFEDELPKFGEAQMGVAPLVEVVVVDVHATRIGHLAVDGSRHAHDVERLSVTAVPVRDRDGSPREDVVEASARDRIREVALVDPVALFCDKTLDAVVQPAESVAGEGSLAEVIEDWLHTLHLPPTRNDFQFCYCIIERDIIST